MTLHRKGRVIGRFQKTKAKSEGGLQHRQDHGVHHIFRRAAPAQIVAGLQEALQEGAVDAGPAEPLGDLVADILHLFKTGLESDHPEHHVRRQQLQAPASPRG